MTSGRNRVSSGVCFQGRLLHLGARQCVSVCTRGPVLPTAGKVFVLLMGLDSVIVPPSPLPSFPLSFLPSLLPFSFLASFPLSFRPSFFPSYLPSLPLFEISWLGEVFLK